MRVAFVGAGRAADKHHARLSAHPEAELMGFGEPDAGRSGARSAKWGVPGRPDLAALAAVRPDALVVMVPLAVTRAAMAEALRVAPAILLEKPVATSLADADAVAAMAGAASATVLVGQDGLRHPGLVEARRAIADGAIGRVTAGTTEGSGSLPLHEGDVRCRTDLTGGGVWMDVGSRLIYSLTAVMGPVVETLGMRADPARHEWRATTIRSCRWASPRGRWR